MTHFSTVSKNGLEMMKMAGQLVRAALDTLEQEFCPDEERRVFGLAFPIAFYDEMGFVYIGSSDGFYLKG